MSAQVWLSGEKLRDLAGFLEAITKATNTYGVKLNTGIGVEIVPAENNALRISWDAQTNEYVIDEQVGS